MSKVFLTHGLHSVRGKSASELAVKMNKRILGTKCASLLPSVVAAGAVDGSNYQMSVTAAAVPVCLFLCVTTVWVGVAASAAATKLPLK